MEHNRPEGVDGRPTVLEQTETRNSSDLLDQTLEALEDEARTAQSRGTESPAPARPAAVVDAKDYSDLEVVAVIPPSYGDARDKLPVIDTWDKDTAVGGVSYLSPSSTDPVPAYPVGDRSSFASRSPLSKGGDYVEWERENSLPSKYLAQQRKFLGMNRKTLSVVVIGIIAILLIILSAVMGVTLGKTMGNGPSEHAATSRGTILNNSRLAALNWTDSQATDRSAVFYQDASNSIMVSLRDSISNEWTQRNVTRAILNSTGASKLDVLPGTPLAAVTNRYQVSLYYLTSDNNVAELWASDIVGDVWFAGSLGTSLTSLQAMNGSSLSAQWQICNNCSNSLCVVYQQQDGDIQVANLTSSSWAFSGPITDGTSSFINRTGLAVRPFTEDNGAGNFGTDPNAIRIFSFDYTGLVELGNGPATNFTWESDIASMLYSRD